MAINQGLKIGKIDTSAYNLFITDAGIFTTFARSYNMISIPGRSGDLEIDNNKFENGTLTFPAVITEDFMNNMIAFKSAINRQVGYQKIVDPFMPGYFRMGIYINDGAPKMSADQTTGSFTIKFNCKPQLFRNDGQTATSYAGSKTYTGNPINLTNAFADSIGSLVVNGKTTQAGSGTPSPTNIRAITGVTAKATVNGTEYSLATDSLFDGDTVDIVTGKVHRKYLYKHLAIADMNNIDHYPGWAELSWLSSVAPANYNGLIKNALCSISSVIYTNTNTSTNLILFFNSANVGNLTQTQLKANYPNLVVDFLLPLLSETDTTVTGNSITNAQGNISVSAENTMTLTTNAEQYTITNPTGYITKPLIRLYGKGTLGIGDYTIIVNTAGTDYIDFDCETMDAYEGSQNRNGNVTVAHEPFLNEDITGITLTGLTKVEITARWFTIL